MYNALFEGCTDILRKRYTMTVQQVVSKPGYTAPTLVVYGGMATLTAAGSTGDMEQGSSNSGVMRS